MPEEVNRVVADAISAISLPLVPQTKIFCGKVYH
jgi:hypothetical protein